MMSTMKKFAAGALVVCAFCLALAPGLAWGAETPGVYLDAGDSGKGNVEVKLVLPDGSDKVGAFKLTLVVDSAAVDLEFAFPAALGAEVHDARIQRGDNVQYISLYVASKDGSLFSGTDLNLGNLALSSEDSVGVRVAVESFEAVNTAHDVLAAVDLGMDLPADPVEVESKADTGTTPEPPAGEGEGNEPGSGDNQGSGEGTGTGSGNGGTGSGNGSANTSPGAPTGTDQSLVTTGDSLASSPAALGTVALAAAAVVALGLVRLGKRR